MRREVYPQDIEPGTKISCGPFGPTMTVVEVKHHKSKGGVVLSGPIDDSGEINYYHVLDQVPFIFWDEDNE